MSSTKPIKVVFLGESNVGKTCMISQIMEGKFDPNIQSSTGGIYYEKKLSSPDKGDMTLDLWDTSGKNEFRSLTKIFYMEAKAVILVYDPTDENTFKELKEYWYNQIKSLNAIIVVAANKCDLGDKKVKDEEGKEFADSIGAIFSSISAKENIGISALIDKIVEASINKK